jgi:hypothetical protein
VHASLSYPYYLFLPQVLFFIPMMRSYLLQHPPDQDREFSLTCETAFLFRMLHSAAQRGDGGTCQAANLLRSLRQSREASMLGLLEGHKNEARVKTNKGDIEVMRGATVLRGTAPRYWF